MNQKFIFQLRHLAILFFVAQNYSCSTIEKNTTNIFRYNEAAGISSLDPAFARNQANMWPIHQLYNTLVEYDDQLKLQPSITKSWTFSSDKLEIRFQLRQDVFFHDCPAFPNGKGRKLVASDVVFSLNRIMDANVASPGAWIFRDKLDTRIPFSAPDDSTFCIRLNKPDITVLSSLSMPYCSIVPKEAVTYYGNEFRSHPVGTGPFKWVSWDETEALILHKNDHYFEKDSLGNRLPYLDGIKVSFLGSKTAEFLAFRQQQLDFINEPDASLKDELISKTGHLKPIWQEQFAMKTGPYLNTEYLGFLLLDHANDNVLLNTKIRRAIHFAIDKKKMIFYLRNSMGIPATVGFTPLAIPSIHLDSALTCSYNPDSARQLIAASGFDDAHPMPEIRLLTVPNYANLGTFIANELKAVGIQLQVEIVQKSLLTEQMSKGDASFFRGSWIADFPDALNFLSVFYSKNPAPPNYTRFNNTEYDSLYEKALTEYDDSIRFRLYESMEQIIDRETPVIPLWYDRIFQLHHLNISGLHPNPLNILDLRIVRKS